MLLVMQLPCQRVAATYQWLARRLGIPSAPVWRVHRSGCVTGVRLGFL